jgi:hydrophobe/amphiphile efflux-3 (HAE3) family protein
MRRFWSVLAVQLGKRAGLVSIIGLLATMIMGFGLTKLEFSTGQDSYLNKGDQVAKDNIAYQKLFGGQIMIVLFTMDDGSTVADLAKPANRKIFDQVKAELEKSPEVRTVVSPLDGLVYSANLLSRTPDDPTNGDKPFTADVALNSIASQTINASIADAEKRGDTKSLEVRQADLAKTTERLTPFLAPDAVRTLDNPDWVNVLLIDNEGKIRKPLRSFFFDDKHAQMVVRLVGNASIEEEGKGAVAVKEAWADKKLDGASVVVTGAPVLLKDLNDYLRGGILKLGAIALAVMVVILLVLFNVRWRLLPLAVIVVGVTWAFGMAGYIGIPLSVVTIAGLPVMLGVGIDYAIQMHARVEEEVLIDRAEHPIQETSRNLGPALLVVTFDAVFAFSALFFAKVPMIRAFGLLLAVGIAIICACSIFVPLAALGAREYRSPTTGRDFREGALGRFVVWLGSISPRLAVPFAIASLLVFAGGIAVESKLTLQTDPVLWVNQHSQNRKDVATLEERTDASSELGVYVVAKNRESLFSDATARWVDKFTDDSVKRYPEDVLVGSNLLTPLSYLVDLDGAANYAPTGALMEAAHDAAPESIQNFTVSPDAPAINILFVTRPRSLEERSVMVDEMRDRLKDTGKGGIAPPDGIRATPSGLAVVGVGLLQNLEANRVLLTYLAIAFVGAFLTVRLRSVWRALLSLVPVLIATGAASLVAYAFSLKLSPMTAVGGPLVIAVCTEFTSLILLRFVEERHRGLTPEASAHVVATRTGRAFVVSGLTAISGVAVIATSSLPILRDFGIVVAMNVVVALISALVILPPMLVWADQPGRWWVSRHLVPQDILDHATKTHDEATETPDLGEAGPIPHPAPAD